MRGPLLVSTLFAFSRPGSTGHLLRCPRACEQECYTSAWGPCWEPSLMRWPRDFTPSPQACSVACATRGLADTCFLPQWLLHGLPSAPSCELLKGKPASHTSSSHPKHSSFIHSLIQCDIFGCPSTISPVLGTGTPVTNKTGFLPPQVHWVRGKRQK